MVETSEVAKQLKRLRRTFRVPVRSLAHALRPGAGPSVYSHYEDRFKGEYIPVEIMQKLAPVFLRYGVKLETLNALTGTVAQPSRLPLTDVLPDARPSRFGDRDLPIYGAAQGGQVGFLNHDTTKALDWTYTPPELIGVKGAFALFMNGDSMTDAGLRAGATVHVHPHRPPRAGDYCVLVKNDLSTLIKRFEGQRGGKIILWQSNPKETFDVPASDVRALFTITSANFVR